MPDNRMRVETIEQCPYCKYDKFQIDEMGELVCDRCGSVLEGYVTRPQNHAAPSYDESHHKVDGKTKYKIDKLQKKYRVRKAGERSIEIARIELDKMASNLSLMPFLDESLGIYRKAVINHLVRGRNIRTVAAASLYAVCRKNGVPRLLDEIADSCSISRKDLGRTFIFISRKLKLRLGPTDPDQYVYRLCSELLLDECVRKGAHNIIIKANEKGLLSGRNPASLAAAAIYIASIQCGRPKSQNDIARVSGMTDYAIRQRYLELVEKLNIDLHPKR